MNTQKFILTTAFLLLSALYASAYDFTVDGMYYNFISGTENVEVTKDYDNPYEGDIVIPETVSWEGKVYQVTEIDRFAFWYSAITSCLIPNTITKIGSAAFNGTDLSNITIPASVIEMERNVFEYCENLSAINVDTNNPSFSSSNGILFDKEKMILMVYPAKKIETTYSIPASITVIEQYAFRKCTNLTSINIPEGVTTIRYGAFAYCENLPSIIIPNSVISIEDLAFSDCYKLKSVTLPNSIEEINYCTFFSCYDLTTIIIPNSVTYIGVGAFDNCTSLKSVSFSNSLQTIGGGAFDRCPSLESITLPNTVKTIGGRAFFNTKITSVKIPNSVTSIGGSAFSSSFIEVIIDDDNPNYTIEDGVLYSKDKTSLILYPRGKSATTFIVPNSVKIIERNVFDNNTTLTSIVLPEGLETIEDYAFWYSRIENIVFPNTLKKIGYAAFETSYIKSITFPASIEYIDSWAFTKCPYLKSIVFEGPVEYMGGLVFAGEYAWPRSYTIEVKCEPFKIENSLGAVDLENSTLIVPDGTKDLFLATAGWQDFGTILEKSQVVPVTNITGVPTETIAGTSIALVGTVIPEDAFYQTVVWSVNDAGTTGAYISGNNLRTPSAGTVEIMATITNGTAVAIDYTQNFSIAVNTNTGIPEAAQASHPIYPNPTDGMVYTEKDSDIKVYSSQGALLQSTFGSQVDLSVYPKGLYLLQINGEMIKVIKK